MQNTGNTACNGSTSVAQRHLRTPGCSGRKQQQRTPIDRKTLVRIHDGDNAQAITTTSLHHFSPARATLQPSHSPPFVLLDWRLRACALPDKKSRASHSTHTHTIVSLPSYKACATPPRGHPYTLYPPPPFRRSILRLRPTDLETSSEEGTQCADLELGELGRLPPLRRVDPHEVLRGRGERRHDLVGETGGGLFRAGAPVG